MSQNTLMFEVGVQNTVEGMENLKRNFSKDIASLQGMAKIKVEIENLKEVTEQLSKIGDSAALRNLRQEIEAINKEFLKLSKGAGGKGSIIERGLAQEIEQEKQKLDGYKKKLEELIETRSKLVGGSKHVRYQSMSKEIDLYNVRIEGANKKIAQLNSRMQEAADASEKMKKSMSGTNVTVNLGQDFAKWAKEVQAMTASVRELVEQLQRMNTVTTKAPQGSIFDSQKFTTLQEAIDKIIAEINRLQQAFTRLGENSSLSNLSTTINGLAVTLSTLSNAVKFTGSSEEIAAYEAKIKGLQQTITQLENKAKELNTTIENVSAGVRTQAEKKGSESVLADNLQKLKSALADVRSEYDRLNEAYAQGKSMGMSTNNDIEQRLYILRNLIKLMDDLASKAQKVGTAEADALSKTKAFSFVQFEGNQLFSKETNRLYTKKEIDGYIKMIDDFIKAEGRMAQTSGAATNVIAEIGTALGRAAEKASQAGNAFAQTTTGLQNFAVNVETARLAYDKTLRGIADLESRISAGQKANMDKESLDLMNGLKQRAQQYANVLKSILGEDMKGNPAYRNFLSMSSNILTHPQVGNMFTSLLGSDWKILLKDIGSTFGMLMKFSGFNKELTLDNSTLANWQKGEEAIRRLDNALKDLNNQWNATNKEAKTPDITAKYEAQKNAIESLIAQIRGAMTEEARMSNRNGLADLLGVNYKNTAGYNNTRLIQEMRTASKDASKAEVEYMKEVDKFTEQSKKAYAQAEKEKEQAAKERAAAVAAAEKQVQNEITKTESLQKKIAQSVTRGEAAGRDMSGLKAQNSELEKQIRLMEALKNSLSRGTTDPTSDMIGKRIKETQTLREDTELLRKSEEKLNVAREQANKRNDNQQLKNLMDEEKSVKNAWNRYEELRIKIAEVEALKQRGEKLKMDVTGIDVALAKYKALRNYMVDIINNGGRTTASFGRAKVGMLAGEFWESQGKSTNLQAKNDIKAFNKELTETERQSNRANDNIRKLGISFNELKNYMKQNGGSEEMRKLQSEIQVAIQKMRQLMNIGDYKGATAVYERLSGLLRQASSATRDFEHSQQNLSSTVSKTNSHLMGQSQILSDLKTMAMQYLSVWGAQNFINNIIELGGQLEQQRLSIGAILQDTAQANHLFSQIKDLAIKSPFGVQQLDQMSKQLTAYGFQYSELYDWTKRLADISAATGTSVDRLALALGHVRSEGALSGYTLRQFSMGNIPMLQKLSENLGKTKQEIRKMTRNKEIGYEDVLDVLKQLTDEGGMFFEAQETMAQALNAKFKNLRDSFQIMYSEMAEGAPGDALKRVAEVLTDISKSWRVLMPMVLAGAGALGAWKLSTMALNHELERNGKLLVGNALATSKYSINQLRAIATTGRFTVAIRGLGRALMSIGKFIFNPVTLGFAAVEGLIYLWSRHNDEVRKAADLTKSYGEMAVESEKNIAKQLEKIKPFSSTLDESQLKTGIDSMTEAIKNYAINGQSIINKMFDKDSEGRVMSLADKYQYLRGELESTMKMYKELKKVKDAFEYGINAADNGWFDDNVETELTQYAKAYKEFVDDVTNYNSKYSNSIEKAIANAEKSDPAFRKATENLTSYGEKLAEFWSNHDKYQNAAKYMNDLFGSGAGSGDALKLNESFFKFFNKKDDALKELDQFIKETENRLKEKGYDFSKELAPEQVDALLKMSKDWLERHPEWENIYSTIKEKLEGRWPIKIVPDESEVEENLPQWLEDLQKELDKTGITLTANMSMEQIIDEMKKAYDKAQTTINKLGPIAMQAKINIQGLSDEDIEKYNDPTSFLYNPEMYNTLKSLKGAHESKTQVDAAAKKRGVNLEGMKKDGSHKNAKEKKDQESAKAVREQVRIIKEAADAFQYWREKVGDKGAWEHVQEEFGDVLAKIGITADNIDDVRQHLNNIPKTKEYNAIKDKKVKTEIDKEIAKENDQYRRKDFEKNTEEFLSKTQIEIENLTKAWDTFNSVLEATGNIQLAESLSGADYSNGKNRNLADALRQKIQNDFTALGSEGIGFDINLDDKQIEKQIQTAMPKASEDAIKGMVEEYKKWRDLQRDVLSKDIDMLSKIIGGAKDYENQIRLINEDLRKQKELISIRAKNGEIGGKEAENATQMVTAKADYDKWKLTYQYSQLMNNSLAMTKQEIENGINVAMQKLNALMEANQISAKEYADDVAKLNNLMKEWNGNALFGSNGLFAAGAKGGLSGISSYYRRRQNAATEEYADLRQKVQSGNASTTDVYQMGLAWQKANKNKESAERVEGIDNFTSSMDALCKAMEPVVKLFDELGMKEVGQAVGGVQSAIGGAASGGLAATMLFGASAGIYGAAIGAGLSLISTVAPAIFGNDNHAEQLAIQEEIKKKLDIISDNVSRMADEMKESYGLKAVDYYKKSIEGIYSSQKEYWKGLEAAGWDNYGGGHADWWHWNKNTGSMADEIARTYGLTATGGWQSLFEQLANMDGIEGAKILKDIRENHSMDWWYVMQTQGYNNGAMGEWLDKWADSVDEFKEITEDFKAVITGTSFDDVFDEFLNGLYEFANGTEDVFDEIEKNWKKMINKMVINNIVGQKLKDDLQKWYDDKFSKAYDDGRITSEETEELLSSLEQLESKYKGEVEELRNVLFDVSDDSSSTSGSIKNISENTADLLASYINAIRADVSVNRYTLQQIYNLMAEDMKNTESAIAQASNRAPAFGGDVVFDDSIFQQYMPLVHQTLTAGNAQLVSINQHVSEIERQSKDIAESNSEIRDLFKGLRNGAWRMPME